MIYSFKGAVLLCFKLHCSIGGGWEGGGCTWLYSDKEFFEEKAMMYWTWESLLISVCMLMNLVLCMHGKTTLCLCLFRWFYVEPLSCRHYCVICITLIPKIIATVAGFLFICLCCARRGSHSWTPNWLFVCLIAWLYSKWAPLALQTPAFLSTLTAAALIHKQNTHSHALSHDYTNAQTGLQPWLAHAHKTHSLTHSLTQELSW